MTEKNTETPELKPAKMVIRHLTYEEKLREYEWLERQMKRDEAELRRIQREKELKEICEKFTKIMLEKGFSQELIDSVLSDLDGKKAEKKAHCDKPVMIIRHLTPEERKREIEWLEEQARRDEASLRHMWRDEESRLGRERVTQKMLEQDYTPEEIEFYLSPPANH